MQVTEKECQAIFDNVSGSPLKWAQKVDEIICAIQSRDEIEYVEDEEE